MLKSGGCVWDLVAGLTQAPLLAGTFDCNFCQYFQGEVQPIVKRAERTLCRL
jgi:hypothetical protein